ncbi:MAG: AMP-binding protein [Halioglobus sp.]
MSGWNLADAVYQLAEGPRADSPALIHDEQVVTYAELRRRACGIGAWLIAQGLPSGAHIGHYMRNSNAYMEVFEGAAMAGMSHLNINYRYRDDELVDLCNGLDVRVLVYDLEFAPLVEQIRKRLPAECLLVQVGGDAELTIEALYDHPQEGFVPRTAGDDLFLIATGGTTGLPKGVQWRHEDIWRKQGVSMGVAMSPLKLEKHPLDMAEHIANVERLPISGPILILSPLMHGTGLLMAIMLVAQGTPVGTLGGAKFDANRTLDFIKQHKAASLVIVGDAFAIPLLEALDARESESLLASVGLIMSSGTALSQTSKEGLMRHQPRMLVIDSLGSTETSGYAMATSEPGVFQPTKGTVVLDDNHEPIEPGSEFPGIAYTAGYLPVGYYNAPEETAKTFLEINGKRYVRTGDRCTVREDGMLVLLGRDSTVINTGGEKVYTVEVERVILEHAAVSDVIVMGLPHPRFGKQVVAVVEGEGLANGALDVEGLRNFVRERLADYKVPKLIYAIDDLNRAPNGKPNYPYVTEFAERCAQTEAAE